MVMVCNRMNYKERYSQIAEIIRKKRVLVLKRSDMQSSLNTHVLQGRYGCKREGRNIQASLLEEFNRLLPGEPSCG